MVVIAKCLLRSMWMVVVGEVVVMTGVASSLVSPVVVTAAVATEHRGVGDAG